jgi:ribonuclease BN (tRNA processing enzyme)
MIDTQLGKRTDVLPIYGHEQDQEQFTELTFQDYCKGYSVSPESTLEIGPFHFRFVPTTHPVYCLAMEVSAQGKKLFYTADTEWDERLLSFSEKADILLCEANLYRELKGKVQGHLTGEEAGVLAVSRQLSAVSKNKLLS